MCTKKAGLIFHGGNEGDCLDAPWSLLWCPWNATVMTVEIYNYLIGCPSPRAQKRTIPDPKLHLYLGKEQLINSEKSFSQTVDMFVQKRATYLHPSIKKKSSRQFKGKREYYKQKILKAGKNLICPETASLTSDKKQPINPPQAAIVHIHVRTVYFFPFDGRKCLPFKAIGHFRYRKKN